jgi:hypothetical protein
MALYRVKAGKHNYKGKDGVQTFVRQGGTIELTDEEAAKFPDKFELVKPAAKATPVAEAPKAPAADPGATTKTTAPATPK